MRKQTIRTIVVATVSMTLGLLNGLACRQQEASPAVAIGQYVWFVEVADTPEARYQGLSGRRSLPENQGMIFVYQSDQVLEYCMRGCEIPLDIAFVDANMRIVRIYTMAVEPDRAGRQIYSSIQPARYALEVPAGGFARPTQSQGISSG